MLANGTQQTRLTSNTVIDQLPAFSPDGSKIIFTSDVSNAHHIFSMDPDGSHVTQLTTTPDANPAPGPNGRKIAFASTRDGGDNEIYVMNADGTGQRRITTSAGVDAAPAWQPAFPPQTIGVFRFTTQQWLLRNSNSNGPVDISFNFGNAGDVPVTG